MTFDPTEWAYDTWRLFFAGMALWNLALALPGVIAPRAGVRALYGVGSRDFHTWFQHWMVSTILLFLGAGYGLVAWDPAANVGLVALGLLVKVYLALTLVALHLGGKATTGAALVGVTDLVFAGLFAVYLFGGARAG